MAGQVRTALPCSLSVVELYCLASQADRSIWTIVVAFTARQRHCAVCQTCCSVLIITVLCPHRTAAQGVNLGYGDAAALAAAIAGAREVGGDIGDFLMLQVWFLDSGAFRLCLMSVVLNARLSMAPHR